MSAPEPALPLESFVTFGDLLKYLRRRARLTQREVAIAAGYSEAQISRLEQNQRPPDLSAVTALLIPALYIEDEPEIVARLLDLAAQARGEPIPGDGSITFGRAVRQEVLESVRTVEEDSPNNLPFELTSFVGREREMAEIQGLFAKARLITLTGGGGAGKTRLALELANQQLGKYRDGIWFIQLTSISDSRLLPQAVASALGLSPSHEGEQSDALLKYLKTKELLLIFDNCEQIVSATSNFSEEILRTCRDVQILTTSREVLNVPGEARFRVPSLALPPAAEIQANHLSQYESIRLFVDRATSIMPSFLLIDSNASAVAQICRRVDGMPLAIELAAAQLTTLSAQEIASRLENSFQLLQNIPRQQTLLTTIEWSYGLLSDPERELLRQLSVFVGGCTLGAVESVTDNRDVLDLLSQLVNKSLVVVNFQTPGETRYHLPEVVREYSLRRLGESGRQRQLEERHFDFFFHLAKLAEAGFMTSDHQEWLKRLDAEQDNLRAGLGYGMASRRFEDTLLFAGTLFWYWQTLGYISEGRSNLKVTFEACALELSADQGLAGRAKACWCAAGLAWIQGDYSAAKSQLQESIVLWRRLGEEKGLAIALREAGIVATYQGELEEAHACLKESIQLLQKTGHSWDLALAYYNEGLVFESQNDAPTARTNFVESQSIFRKLREPWGLAVALFGLGRIAGRQADYVAAHSYLEESLELSRELEDLWSIASALYLLGEVLQLQDNSEEARRLFLESLRLNRVVGDPAMISFTLHNLGKIAEIQDELEQAAQLFGAAKSLREDSTNTTSWSLTDHKQCEQDVAFLRTGMGQEIFDRAWAKGHIMNSNDAIEYALLM